ncbi:LysR family transcriptional regulator [Bradyrhizobium sp. CB1650]|uniref:LysR family transcriptional regulator n=1 Tax=Bradyrhizobium sp. CB1650 TaxID=3039153 RepID=UPI0024353F32|nr:LysR family transcriptional regulator [Bradyrhizobium sp. CB1650]WGD53078.1 LysR family transcriptional regulator [Bradyrhizobium sp. CB1650]
MSRLDLNLLLTLDAVLSERSVARAAERLNVTPSAVSNALARLRHELGDPLVVRNGRGVVPTPRALTLAPTLRRALQSLEQAVRDETFDPATTTRRFTLAMADAGQVSQLPRLGRLMAAEMPCASLRVVGIDTFLAWGGAQSIEVDAAIANPLDDSPGMHASFLYVERGVLVARRDHALANKDLAMAELRHLQHVDVEVAPGRGYSGLDDSYAHLGIDRVIAMVVPSFMAAAAVVADTDLVATLPVSLVQVFSAQFGLIALEGIAPTQCTPLHLIWHERTHFDPAASAFRAIVHRAFGAVTLAPGRISRQAQ